MASILLRINPIINPTLRYNKSRATEMTQGEAHFKMEPCKFFRAPVEEAACLLASLLEDRIGLKNK
jgi:hypothetical protein